ncbi:MAG: pyridoxal-phosphate dependent enzyme [Daejeonella sp.]|uniref:1-aminocyclopropane-1-carboxylate deaminase/D-cysteine desulfhydrase n=1 Tax=Daejeonella sp. TaxID=2805397 RepID=UPI00273374D8|nr:pyridoxal-phosphate dependent enzyme [Daejeonella sp.]MDP3470150.1 pyridoxal-phosphate dependent enzyme [Daejeonella sp.]
MIDLPIYSPLEEIFNPLFSLKGVQIFIKRDDMIHPFISGNKWRKLKYILLEAKEHQKKHLVTFGGAYSNHLIATACAAAKFGFNSTGIVRGENVENETLLLCRLFGMQLIFEDRESYRDKSLLFKKHFHKNQEAFFIDEGGSGSLAAKGCSELIDELPDVYDHLFCAAGTGTTAAGILSGINRKALSTKMHVVPVLKGADFLKNGIDNLTNGAFFEFHTDYHFGGYAKTSDALLNFIKDFTSSTGILIDPVYTGKLLYAIYDLISKDYFAPESRILAVHTGGITGILGMAERFKF